MKTLYDWCIENNREDLLKEWHSIKNCDLNITDVGVYSGRKVWWICEHGHEWETIIANRTRQKSNCPICGNKKIISGINDLQTLKPEIAKEWHPTKNGDLKPSDVSIHSCMKVYWTCSKGHEWKAAIESRTRNFTGCPKCNEYRKVSFPEKALLYYLKLCFPEVQNNYVLPYSNNMELDIFIENLNLGIEYDGSHFHKKQCKDARKYDICKEYGISLIRIREKDCLY